MYDPERRIREAANIIAQMLETWPDMDREDVQAVNQATGWTPESYADPLTETELNRAWQLAQGSSLPPIEGAPGSIQEQG